MNIAIVGYDTEGRASYDYFAAQGHSLTICDQNQNLQVPAGVSAVLGSTYLDGLDRFDMIVRTAGLPPRLILDKNPDVAAKVTTHTNEFLNVSPTANIIGITGTKGKGTTSTLVAKMLQAAGLVVRLGGNIGVPPLTFLNGLTPDSWVVLELSSFQLVDMKCSPRLAACLMVVPEHLNWHANMDEYVAAKQQLFRFQAADDVAVYNAENALSQQIAGVSAARKIPYLSRPGAIIQDEAIVIGGQTVCKTSELKLLGRHNWQNACAAVTLAWQVTHDLDAMRSVLTTFSGLEHRLEFVRQVGGVSYYDDSFGTTPETAMVALQAFEAPKVLVLGGSDKGASYDGLARAVLSGNVRHVVLVGEQAGRIQAALEAAGYTSFGPGGSTMPEIVQAMSRAAQPGDVALLSTACASFDLFKNYKDRGEQFKRAVAALVE